jgi:hypothetical protein
MKQTINKTQFASMFREIRPENFCPESLDVLFDWLEEYEEGTGEDMELDPIALCCDFAEMTCEEAAEQYNVEEWEDADDIAEALDEMVLVVNDDLVIVGP